MQGKIVLIFKGLFDTFSFLRKAGGVELKWTHDAETASSQVKEKGYADPGSTTPGKSSSSASIMIKNEGP